MGNANPWEYLGHATEGHCVHFNFCVDEPVMKTNFEQLFQNSAKSRTAEQNGYQQLINNPNILLIVATDYPPVPRSSMRNTIAMLAQIHKYVQQCKIMQGDVVAA